MEENIVIVNEFGEQGIDNDLVVDAEEEAFEMNNGYMLHRRGDLIRIPSGLMKRVDKLILIVEKQDLQIRLQLLKHFLLTKM